jgi:hypothetical protein
MSNSTDHVSVVRSTDKKIAIPEGMTYSEAASWCLREEERMERKYTIREPIRAFPLDGAYAFVRALRELYGWIDPMATHGFFGKTPPTMIQIETSFGEFTRVPWGRMASPGFEDGVFTTGIELVDGRAAFVIGGEVKQKFRPKVDELVELTQRYAKEDSIYKGKAIRVNFPNTPKEFDLDAHTPRFMDFSHVDETGLIFPEKLAALIDIALFTPVEQTQECRDLNIPLKRGILLEGDPGTGKTLTMSVVASKAARHGWTYIHIDSVELLNKAIKFARDFQPAIVVVEDIDRIDPGGKRNDAMNTILNTLDGSDIKGTEIMVVATTNRIEDIRAELLRPGRIDAVIPIRTPDAVATKIMLERFTKGSLAIGEDLTEAGRLLEGVIPAIVREVADRGKLAALRRVRGTGEPIELTANDLEITAHGMKEHLTLLVPKVEDKRSDIEKAAAVIGDALLSVQGMRVPQRTNGALRELSSPS